MLKTALIILTLSASGQTHFALMETDTAQDCHAAAETISAILQDTDIRITAMRCGQTALTLTGFEHGHAEEDMRWLYRVTIHGDALNDGFTAELMTDGTCNAIERQTYCAISAQHPVTQ